MIGVADRAPPVWTDAAPAALPCRRGAGRVEIARLPRGRRVVLDVLRLAARQPTMHGLTEVDITSALAQLRASPARPTMTAYVVATLGRALREWPEVNARRAGGHVIHFSCIDIAVTVERRIDGHRLPVPVVIANADRRSVAAVTAELRADRTMPLSRPELGSGRSVLALLPPLVRRLGAIAMGRFPRAAAHFGPPVGVTSLGMFGAGWGIPLSPMTLMVTVGGTTTRPVLVDGELANHTFLPLTFSFDHTVVDGAPAARFATTFRRLLETGTALDEVEP